MNFYSTGGCGDALLVAAKIFNKIDNSLQGNFSWVHAERHECHKSAIEEIQRMFVKYCSKYNFSLRASAIVHSHGKPEDIIWNILKKTGGTYVTTDISKCSLSLFDSLSTVGEPLEKGYIVIVTNAGRPMDNTNRFVSYELIEQVSALYKRKVILLGTTKIEASFNDKDILNLTGITSLDEAFGYIEGSSFVIGHDGLLSYYSALRGIPCLIAYHSPDLPAHYYSPDWGNEVIRHISGNFLEKLNRDIIKEIGKIIL